jgi:hypothetical protein
MLLIMFRIDIYEVRLKSSWTGGSEGWYAEGGGDLCQIVVVGVT